MITMIHKNADNFFWTWTSQSHASRIAVTASHDCYFRTSGGHHLLDAISTNFQVAFGHSCAPIKDAIHMQVDAMPAANPKHEFELKTRVSSKLCAFVDSGPGRIFYTLSGAEAVENALKMARQITGRSLVAARAKSYHGATMGAMSVTGDWRGQGHFGAQDATLRIPEPSDDPDLSLTRRMIESSGANKIAAMCLETISGMNGVIIPDASWWRGIESLCHEFKILLIIDEVSCGFGRTGKNLAMHHYGIKPDFVCMAKAISGGYVPFGALWVKEEVAQFYDDNMLSAGLTAYAHPLGLAAADAVLDLIKDQAFQSAKVALTGEFTAGLLELKNHPQVKAIRNMGLMAAIDLKSSSSDVGPRITWERGLDYGLHFAIKENSIILAPPFVMTSKDNQLLFQGLEKFLENFSTEAS